MCGIGRDIWGHGLHECMRVLRMHGHVLFDSEWMLGELSKLETLGPKVEYQMRPTYLLISVDVCLHVCVYLR